ncbi:MAG: DUF6498-containing protein [Nanoarchaeota archaeon]
MKYFSPFILFFINILLILFQFKNQISLQQIYFIYFCQIIIIAIFVIARILIDKKILPGDWFHGDDKHLQIDDRIPLAFLFLLHFGLVTWYLSWVFLQAQLKNLTIGLVEYFFIISFFIGTLLFFIENRKHGWKEESIPKVLFKPYLFLLPIILFFLPIVFISQASGAVIIFLLIKAVVELGIYSLYEKSAHTK